LEEKLKLNLKIYRDLRGTKSRIRWRRIAAKM